MGILIKSKNKLLISITFVIFAALCFFNYASNVKARECLVRFYSEVNILTRHMQCPAHLGDYMSLPNVTQDGYTLNGWYTKQSGGQRVTASTFVYNDVTYYAQWDQIKYILIMRASGGSPATKEVQLYYEKSYDLSQNIPTKPGYVVSQWRNSKTGRTYSSTATVSRLGTKQNQSVYLDAYQWSQISYTLILVHNNGTGNTTTKSLSYETPYSLGDVSRNLNNNRPGYTLSSWKNTDTGNTYSTTSSVSRLGKTQGQKVRLYAQWTPHKYTVVFNANGGTGTMGAITDRYYGNTYSLPANKFTKEDYIFVGWKYQQNGVERRLSDKQQYSNLTTTDKGTVTLYAQWEKAEEFTISYDLSGGGVSEFNKASYSSTSAPITLHNPTKDGYNFIGWTGSNGDDPQMEVTIPTGSSGNKEFVANYKAKTYELEFLDADGGTKKIEGEFGSEINGIPTSSKKGYTFVAWVDEEGNLIGDIVPLGNKKYYAAFRPNRYTITFKANGGKGSMDDQEFVYDQANKLNKNEFTKDKYVFVGWNTKEDGSGNTYSDEGEILNITDKDKDGIVLYAIWEDAAASKKAKNPKTGAYVSIAIVSVLLVIGAASYLIAKKKINIQKV